MPRKSACIALVGKQSSHNDPSSMDVARWSLVLFEKVVHEYCILNLRVAIPSLATKHGSSLDQNPGHVLRSC